MRFLGKIFTLLAFLLIGGFFVFVASLPRAEDGINASAQDQLSEFSAAEIGIVALTGGGGIRIERALDLYRDQVADRILISGTHPDVRKVDLAERFDPSLLDCCVDLGSDAQTTIGNAIETRDWSADRQYKAIYLVTHDYHMPRALIEVRSMSPELTVVGVPVSGPPYGPNWYKSGEAWDLLIHEYGKFLLAGIRTVL